MYEDRFDLTESEGLEVRQVLTEMAQRGGRLADRAGRPIAYHVLRGRRFLVCEKGLVWRFAAEGTLKKDGRSAGVPRRNNAVEMWTGKWRKATSPDGEPAYAKCIVWVPLDDHINGHPGTSKLGWYRSEKGFKHPFDLPEAPTAEELARLTDRDKETDDAVFARMQAEGLIAPAPAVDEPEAPQERPAGGGKARAS